VCPLDKHDVAKKALAALTNPRVLVDPIPPAVLKCIKEAVVESKTKSAIDMQGIPPALLHTLFPFQLRGIKFALSRAGRCIIAYV